MSPAESAQTHALRQRISDAMQDSLQTLQPQFPAWCLTTTLSDYTGTTGIRRITTSLTAVRSVRPYTHALMFCLELHPASTVAASPFADDDHYYLDWGLLGTPLHLLDETLPPTLDACLKSFKAQFAELLDLGAPGDSPNSFSPAPQSHRIRAIYGSKDPVLGAVQHSSEIFPQETLSPAEAVQAQALYQRVTALIQDWISIFQPQFPAWRISTFQNDSTAYTGIRRIVITLDASRSITPCSLALQFDLDLHPACTFNADLTWDDEPTHIEMTLSANDLPILDENLHANLDTCLEVFKAKFAERLNTGTPNEGPAVVLLG
ncbi:hypothetical protein [Brevifollis gellanilyticus]|uniref:Uncharacterized protein n=1 Tax=Brevifollis gellanilyticus TaxID=748831 RepID=A0A512MB55_9BACT|nr:hypothetical protein [Brevifollis gellanilyticus]GEP43958.1 hypothetical protein BGE01nite_32490 [Brevifollis gellanilyticus]